jgi:hypothetical protein
LACDNASNISKNYDWIKYGQNKNKLAATVKEKRKAKMGFYIGNCKNCDYSMNIRQKKANILLIKIENCYLCN